MEDNRRPDSPSEVQSGQGEEQEIGIEVDQKNDSATYTSVSSGEAEDESQIPSPFSIAARGVSDTGKIEATVIPLPGLGRRDKKNNQLYTTTSSELDAAAATTTTETAAAMNREKRAAATNANVGAFPEDEGLGTSPSQQQVHTQQQVDRAPPQEEGHVLAVAGLVNGEVGIAKVDNRNQYLLKLSLVLGCFLVGGIVAGVVIVTQLGGGGGSWNQGTESITVTIPPLSTAPSGAFKELINILTGLSVTREGIFNDNTTPQYQAAKWLADEDTFLADQGHDFGNSTKVLQRYAVATLYFATGGNDWKICGTNSPSCGDTPWPCCYDTPWLSDADECEWFSLSCEAGNITQINFPATGFDLIRELPLEMSLLSGLKSFLAPYNELQGDVDVAFAELSTLQAVVMPGNRLEGTIPTGILEKNPYLGFLDLARNQFNGPLPTAIAGATKLSHLQLNQNLLTGTIPPQIGNLTSLENFEVQVNDLVGTIPDELYSLTKLNTLSVRENTGITGTINPLIAQLTSLTVLQLGFTGLGGTIPEEVFELTDLSELNLENAAFSGTISESFHLLNNSLMDIFLNHNAFTGSIPQAFDVLTGLETLQLQGNQLTGSISPAVCARRGQLFRRIATFILDCVVTCNCCDNCEI